MAFGVALYNVSGTQIIGMSQRALIFIEMFTCPSGTSGSKTYTALTGRTLQTFVTDVMGHSIVLSVDGSGNPVLTYTARTGTNSITAASVIGVFAL